MGLFDKLKTVLFEEEEVEIPVINKKSEVRNEEIYREEPIRPKQESKPVIPEFEDERIDIKPIKSEPKEDISSFRNVKRDINLDFDMDDTINEFTQELEVLKKDQIKEEPRSPFLSFDEDEFERLNSQIRSNEEARHPEIKDEIELPKRKEVSRPVKKAPVEAPKRFRPSPVISPVYGILDKNYKKEDIVEKADDYNFISEVENAIDVDSVRRKAYGTLEDDIEDNIVKPKVEKVVEEVKKPLPEEIINEYLDEVDSSPTIVEEPEEDITEILDDDIKEIIEEPTKDIVNEIEEKEDVIEDIPSYEEVSNEIEDEDYLEDNEEEESPNEILEKTSTLKILDDIEKELDEVKINKNLDDTDTDLFNLIDSMYERDGE